ncbi:LPO_1073/Vpar_1526 family protein [Winogradskyella haliclonae]|uniref:Uncharacterized protein n=1 Tax=Winogradskyella haliclonae TaxID=2048558 RepID=A0ABQ2BWR2_9FLAO|nr:LPO_1073/Vpar_1526 family protein [Winogradskyella haliclonae]GGI56879.1 hypothetical protein GCM10011444_11880 [Winogradskyella haliclonae]
MIKKSSQKSGNDSINIQESKNVTIGLSYTESKELFSDLFEKNFPRFQEIAQEEARKNVEKLSKRFVEKVNELESFNDSVLQDPDFHYNLYKSIEIGARNSSDELHQFLANLLAKRIGCNENDTKRIIVNESISTIEKISTNQLKILTFSYLFFTYFRIFEFKNWKDFNKYIEEYIEPFMSYEYSLIDLQHLNYSNCTTMESGFGSPSLSQIIKNRNPKLYPDLKSRKDEQAYIDEITKKNLKHQDKFFKMLNSTQLYAINPTSVGFMLISLYFEIITGEKLTYIEKLFE